MNLLDFAKLVIDDDLLNKFSCFGYYKEYMETELIQYIDHGQLSLKALNVEFDFDVSVSYCMVSTDTSKLKLTIGTHLHATISPLFKF